MAASPPIAWIIDGRRFDLESLAQGFDKHLEPFYLAISGVSDSSVGDQAYTDGPPVAKPALARSRGQLFLPSFGCLYLAVAAAIAIAQTEVAIELVGIRHAVGRG